MEFRVLGPLEVRTERGVVALGGSKPRAVLAMLLLHANQAVGAERLALGLWGEDASAHAAKSVQIHVSRLRKAIGVPGVIATTPAGYRADVGSGELDLERFEGSVAEGRSLLAERPGEAAAVLREALALWRGPPLAEFANLPFATGEAEWLEERRLTALELRIEADLESGRHAEAAGELERLIDEHPWRERLHAQRMLALYRSGRQADALAAYRHAQQMLDDELGIEPSPELRALEHAILAQDPALQASRATASPRPVRRSSLPAPLSPMRGREHELALIERQLAAGVRLLTLTGPGGVGKTRIAVDAAWSVQGEFAHGARFAALAPVSAPEDVARAIAAALPIDGEPDETSLRAALRDEQLLLVVDNFEHVLEAAPLIARVLEDAPELRVLATSREPLRIPGEQVLPLAPLVVSEGAAVERSAAVALFEDRAHARDPTFELSDRNIADVAELCRRLDGLPLAIELAAGWIPLLSPAELLEQIRRDRTLLGGGVRGVPERHATLATTVEWSVATLTDAERDAFFAIAAFAGGATIDAAQVVSRAPLRALEALVSKSLLTRRDSRLGMLETIREHAQDGTDEAARRRHAAYYLSLTRDLSRDALLGGPEATGRLEAERDNYRAALAWTAGNEPHLHAELLIAVTDCAWLPSYRAAAAPWLDSEIHAPLTPAQAAALALARASVLHLSDPARLDHAHAALAGFEALGDVVGATKALLQLSTAETMRAHWAAADDWAVRAVDNARRTGSEFLLGLTLSCRSMAQPSYEEASPFAHESAEHLRASGAMRQLAHLLNTTAWIAMETEDYTQAEELLAEALAIAEARESVYEIAMIIGNQGLAAVFQHDWDAAAAAFTRYLELTRDTRFVGATIREAMLGLAACAAGRGDALRAAWLSGAAHAAGEREVIAEAPLYERLEQRLIEPARATLDPATWRREHDAGAAASRSQAVEAALLGRDAGPAR